MPGNYDVIVIGIGSMGSAACYYLAGNGQRVLGIDQFAVPHDSGSHGGRSRIIRKAYFENAGYVPLLQRAYENWQRLESETGEQIYYKTGLLYFGRSGNTLMKGVQDAADAYQIQLDRLTVTEARERFPQFRFPEESEIVFEPEAGFLRPEMAIRLYLQLARLKGAHLHEQEKVIGWQVTDAGVTVTTTKTKYTASKLILTAGAWSGMMIPGFHATIRASRQILAWAEPVDDMIYDRLHFPCWMIAEDSGLGCYYGFPSLQTEDPDGPAGIKLAHHFPGDTVNPDGEVLTDESAETSKLVGVLKRYFNGRFDPQLRSKTCLYGNSPDEDFLLGFLPGYDQRVMVACGFSGHGFKFVSVVGEILAELAIRGKTKLPVSFLRADRFIK